MAELTLDSDLIQQAAAKAIVTLLGDDAQQLVTGLVDTVMRADTGYRHAGKKDTYFDKALRDVITRHVQTVLNQWVLDNDAEVRAFIVARIEMNKNEVLTSVTDDLFKRLSGIR